MEGDLLQVLNPQRLKSFEDWLETTSITLTQVNGQRKYGGPPPDWTGPDPGPGCEVFISHIPRDVYEDTLIPLFWRVAPLYEFRLMMNFSGQNRGFAYAKYGRPEEAAAAIGALHLHPLRDGVQLVVKQSTEKNQLCLSDLPEGMDDGVLLTALRGLSDGVRRVTVRAAGTRGKAASALVLFSSHHAASMAKKVLVQAFKKRYGVSISVRWFPGSSKASHEEHGETRPAPKPASKAAAPKAFPSSPRFQAAKAAHSDPCVLPSPVSPPSPAPPPPTPPLRPQLFSRAVGGPAPQACGRMVAAGGEAVPGDASGHLRWLCELCGLGLPLYDVRYHHTSADGFLCFNYRVLVPGLPMPFCGAAQILPGSSVDAMDTEARRVAAEQVIKAMGTPKGRDPQCMWWCSV